MDLLASYAPASVKEQHAREQELKRQQREDDNKAGAGSSKTTNSKTDSKLEDAKTASASETDTKTAEPLPSASASASPSAVAVQEELLEQLPLFHGFDNELVGPAAVAVATASGEGKDLGFYDPARLAKELNILLENHDVLVEEMRAATNWNAWPETNLYKADEGKDWKVVPFLHTFPATDEANSEWVETNCNQCPKTVEMLRKIPGIRTALYSRMSPNTKLTPHTGWADLSNHVIRCHIPLVAEENTSGVWVLGKVQFHSLKPKPQILVFDDAKVHLGFNLDPKRYRCVLIVDLMRPDWMAPGQAKGGMTAHLHAYIDRFREEVNRVKDPSETEPVKW